MIPHSAPAFTCLVNGQPVSASDSIALETLRPGLQELILLDFPQARPDDRVSQDALVDYRRKYVEAILEEERGEVSDVTESAAYEITGGQPTASSQGADFAAIDDEQRATRREMDMAKMLIDQLPQIVEKAALGLSGANLTVLNGADLTRGADNADVDRRTHDYRPVPA